MRKASARGSVGSMLCPLACLATFFLVTLLAAGLAAMACFAPAASAHLAPPEAFALPPGPVTETTAVLGGTVIPHNPIGSKEENGVTVGVQTTFYVEYSTNQAFTGPTTKLPAEPLGTLPADPLGVGDEPVPVWQLATGLAPDTDYWARVVATNRDEVRGQIGESISDPVPFHTFPAAGPPPSCPNEEFRTGPSEALPDCRAYELVSPPDSGGIRPTAANFSNRWHAFESLLISPSADTVAWQSMAGAPSGTDGTGVNDRYLATRGPSGWASELIGPTGAQGERPAPGGIEPQHDYYFLRVGAWPSGGGSLVTPYQGDTPTPDYLRKPDGSFELIARGSLGEDPTADGLYISAGGGHIIFDTDAGSPGGDEIVQLELEAPPAGINAIYDRALGGPTHVVSLLPGEITQPADRPAYFQGVSADGSAVAFRLGTRTGQNSFAENDNLYVRLDNSRTLEVTSAPQTFAGISASADGEHVFYANAASPVNRFQTPADLFSFETATQTTTQITDVGDARFVNVSADGSRVYFVSESQIGGQGAAGMPNLYLWERAGGKTTFIATVDLDDLTGAGYPTVDVPGRPPPTLVGWTREATAAEKSEGTGAGNNLSRTTPDGMAIVFESKGRLTAYDNAGHWEVYRYRAGDPAPQCVSCDPSGAPATANAALQSFNAGLLDSYHPLDPVNPPANLTENGRTVFFETEEAILPADTNSRRDVYRWSEGDLALISTGKAVSDSFLYAATADGADALFITPEELLPQDRNGATGALYDARVGGGFPVPATDPGPCLGDACQGPPTPPPSDPSSASSSFSGPGNRSEPHTRPRASKRACKHRKHGKRCKKRRPAGPSGRASR